MKSIANFLRKKYWETPVPHWIHSTTDIALAVQQVSCGSNAIDIGADVGLFSIPLGRKVGDNGTVLAFEPNRESYDILRNSVRCRKINSINSYNLALGKTDTDAFLETPIKKGRKHNALSKIKTDLRHRFFQESECCRVPVRTLDSIVSSMQWNSLDFIKIDAEGFELNILQGGEYTLHRFSPSLLIEIEDAHTLQYGHSKQDVLAFLDSLGYCQDEDHQSESSNNVFFQRKK